jgi:rare lipoprotein A
MIFVRRCGLLSTVLMLAACASDKGPAGPAAQSVGAHYKVGQPYQINGTWYYPKEDYAYDETGIASWYGDDFHGKYTANGEIYNMHELTAAHPTLPLPSLARVTNLENGRSIVVRVNDRGPFSNKRLIDVTQRVAQLLGFEKQGTAKVRVQVLADESKAIADAMRRYGSTSVAMASEPADTPVAETSPLLPGNRSVQVAELDPIPTTKAETRNVIRTIKPVAEVRQLPLEGSTQIFVQAGAFTQAANAERLKTKLSAIGATSISEFVKDGATFYRVRLGPVANVGQADQLLQRVLKSGTNNAKIIVD